MNSYRVAFEDSHKGQTFGFAVHYTANNTDHALIQAEKEFPSCEIKNVRLIKDE